MSLGSYNLNVVLLFLFHSGLLAFVLCIGQMLVFPKHQGNRLLILLFLAIGSFLLLFALEEGGWISLGDYGLKLFLLIPQILIGPLLFFVLKYYFEAKDFKFSHLLVHLSRILAAVVIFSFLTLIYFHEVTLFVWYASFFFFTRLVLTGYFLSFLKIFFSTGKMASVSKIKFIKPLVFTWCFVFINEISMLIFCLKGDLELEINLTVNCLLFFISYIYAGRHPEFFSGARTNETSRRIESHSRQNSYLGSLDVDEKIETINRILCEEKIYRDSNLNLSKLARLTEMTPHQLSEIINKRLKTTFYEMINVYRTREACELLISENEFTIRDIAKMIGFKSPSAFYRAFNDYCGVTPTQYRSERK